MKVEHEALKTKHELIVAEQEEQLTKTCSALQETEHVCHERVKVIDQLESTNTELVRFIMSCTNCLKFTVFLHSQEYHKKRLQFQLEGANRDIESLNSDVDVLKTGLNVIAEIIQSSGDGPATPIHEYTADSVVNGKVSVKVATPLSSKGRVGMSGSSSLPDWVTSPVSQYTIVKVLQTITYIYVYHTCICL